MVIARKTDPKIEIKTYGWEVMATSWTNKGMEKKMDSLFIGSTGYFIITILRLTCIAENSDYLHDILDKQLKDHFNYQVGKFSTYWQKK